MEILQEQATLQSAATRLLKETPLLDLLKRLGNPVQTGSSLTGLMVYPDIDFSVQSESPSPQVAINLVATLYRELRATMVKVTDFQFDEAESTAYYLGLEFPFENKTWHIDVNVMHPGPVSSSVPSLDKMLTDIDDAQRMTILNLKRELIETNRYVGARSQPPYTFRSVHLYEGVLKGRAKTIKDLEDYFK